MRVFSKKFTLAAASGLTAVAISSGAAVYAQTDETPEVATTTQETPNAEAEQREGEEKIAKLAAKLGVTEEELTTALKDVREQEGNGETNKAKQLADALGIEEAKVEQAVTESEAEDKSKKQNREALESRLDTAIAEGELTEADKKAVLKAYDAGVLTDDNAVSGGLSAQSTTPSTEQPADGATVDQPADTATVVEEPADAASNPNT